MSRVVPLVLIAAALLAAWLCGAGRLLSVQALGGERAALQGWVAAHRLLAPLAFASAYVAVAALALPGAAVMTLAGGLLLGPWVGAAASVAGASCGAVLVFLAARRVASGWLRPGAGGPAGPGWLARRVGPALERLRPGLERDGFSALLSLRLVPMVPFFVLNLAPALVGMRLRAFVPATVLGVAPATLVLSFAGAGLAGVLDRGGTPDLGVVLRPAVLLPLLGLAALAALPVAWRRVRR